MHALSRQVVSHGSGLSRQVSLYIYSIDTEWYTYLIGSQCIACSLSVGSWYFPLIYEQKQKYQNDQRNYLKSTMDPGIKITFG